MSRDFYSHGKLLLSGEYAVLDGALALALPTRKGQHMRIRPKQGNRHSWIALSPAGEIWLQTSFTSEILDPERLLPNEKPEIKRLMELLRAARRLNPNFLDDGQGYEINTQLEFPRNWGLGSSSTLVNNVAQWAETDAFELLRHSFGGSGYDIACAQSPGPILYRVSREGPEFRELSFHPPFLHRLYFVHLNRKQDSREAVRAYRRGPRDRDSFIPRITELTRLIAGATAIEEFEEAVLAHESLVSNMLGMPTVKQLYFPDFPGTLKSLGAWGGDFILAVGGREVPEYFHGKGYPTVLSYPDLIL